MVDFSKYSFDKKKLWSTIITHTSTYFFKKKKKCNLNVIHIYVFMFVYFNKFTIKLNFTLFSCVPQIFYKTN